MSRFRQRSREISTASEILNNSERGIWTEGGGTLTIVGGTFQGNGLSNIESVGALVSVTDVHTFGGAGRALRDCINLVLNRLCEVGSKAMPVGGFRVDSCPVHSRAMTRSSMTWEGSRPLLERHDCHQRGYFGQFRPGDSGVEQATGFVSNNSVFDTEGGAGIAILNGKYRGDRNTVNGRLVPESMWKQHKL